LAIYKDYKNYSEKKKKKKTETHLKKSCNIINSSPVTLQKTSIIKMGIQFNKKKRDNFFSKVPTLKQSLRGILESSVSSVLTTITGGNARSAFI
jgi:hypothetical protein